MFELLAFFISRRDIMFIENEQFINCVRPLGRMSLD